MGALVLAHGQPFAEKAAGHLIIRKHANNLAEHHSGLVSVRGPQGAGQ